MRRFFDKCATVVDVTDKEVIDLFQRPTKDNSKKTSSGFKDSLKEKCPWHLEGNHTTEPTNSSEHSRTLQTHGLLTTRKARKNSTKATTTSKNSTRR
jgi:hypothetical protein